MGANVINEVRKEKCFLISVSSHISFDLGSLECYEQRRVNGLILANGLQPQKCFMIIVVVEHQGRPSYPKKKLWLNVLCWVWDFKAEGSGIVSNYTMREVLI